MDFYCVEIECGMYCQGGSAKFVVEPYGYGEWAKREDVDALTADRDLWRSRCEAIVAMLQIKHELDDMPTKEAEHTWWVYRHLHAAAVKIMKEKSDG